MPNNRHQMGGTHEAGCMSETYRTITRMRFTFNTDLPAPSQTMGRSPSNKRIFEWIDTRCRMTANRIPEALYLRNKAQGMHLKHTRFTYFQANEYRA